MFDPWVRELRSPGPENYNRLFLPNSKNQANNRFKTLNSKAIGRLLAAGGVYNGNIEGFRDTAEKLGGDAIKGYDQILNEKTAGIAIATASILLTQKPEYVNIICLLELLLWGIFAA